MRDFMERFLVLPFPMGCMSKSTTAAVESTQSRDPKLQSNQLITRIQEEQISSRVKIKNSWGFVALRRSNISRGIRKLVFATFNNFSRILHYKGVEETEEMEMEIGVPTDVKHVTHIGYDGSMTTNPIKNWSNIPTPEILSFPSISLKQFELAMAEQSQNPTRLCT